MGQKYQATLGGVVVAESDATIEVEGNQYFPPSSINKDHFYGTDHSTSCPWKGKAAYYDVKAGDTTAENGAWYYPAPLPKAQELGIKDYVAFWNGVIVEAV